MESEEIKWQAVERKIDELCTLVAECRESVYSDVKLFDDLIRHGVLKQGSPSESSVSDRLSQLETILDKIDNVIAWRASGMDGVTRTIRNPSPVNYVSSVYWDGEKLHAKTSHIVGKVSSVDGREVTVMFGDIVEKPL